MSPRRFPTNPMETPMRTVTYADVARERDQMFHAIGMLMVEAAVAERRGEPYLLDSQLDTLRDRAVMLTETMEQLADEVVDEMVDRLG
jgi:hypothetical protein